MFLVVRWSFDRGFLRYSHALDLERLETVAGKFEEAYASEGSWRFLMDDPQRLHRLLWASLADCIAERPAHGRRGGRISRRRRRSRGAG